MLANFYIEAVTQEQVNECLLGNCRAPLRSIEHAFTVNYSLVRGTINNLIVLHVFFAGRSPLACPSGHV